MQCKAPAGQSFKSVLTVSITQLVHVMSALVSKGKRVNANGEKKKGKVGSYSRKPKHQNSFAFKHNPGSKKTAAIREIVHGGLCKRCNEKVEWKKKYRKYKPLKKPSKCNGCGQLEVRKAYHTLCEGCATERECCAWCCEKKEIVRTTQIATIENAKKRAEVEKLLGDLKERKKRTLTRKYETKELGAEEVIAVATVELEKQTMKEDAMMMGDY